MARSELKWETVTHDKQLKILPDEFSSVWTAEWADWMVCKVPFCPNHWSFSLALLYYGSSTNCSWFKGFCWFCPGKTFQNVLVGRPRLIQQEWGQWISAPAEPRLEWSRTIKKSHSCLFARSSCSNNWEYSAADLQGWQLVGEFGMKRGVPCTGTAQVWWNGTNKVCRKQNLSFLSALSLWGQGKTLAL